MENKLFKNLGKPVTEESVEYSYIWTKPFSPINHVISESF